MSYIYNPERFRQAALLKGLEHLTIHSTDIDAYVDLGGKGRIFIDFKVEKSSLNQGQVYAAKSLIEDAQVPSFFVVACHDTLPTEIIAPEAYVKEVYYVIPGHPMKHKVYPTGHDGWGIDVMSINDFICTTALFLCPRLIKGKKASFYLWEDDILSDVAAYVKLGATK